MSKRVSQSTCMYSYICRISCHAKISFCNAGGRQQREVKALHHECYNILCNHIYTDISISSLLFMIGSILVPLLSFSSSSHM